MPDTGYLALNIVWNPSPRPLPTGHMTKIFNMYFHKKIYPYPSHEVVIRNYKEKEGSDGHFGTKI